MNVRARAGRVSAAAIGVVCGLELVVAVVIGGAGVGALFSMEAAFVSVLLGGVILSTFHFRRRAQR